MFICAVRSSWDMRPSAAVEASHGIVAPAEDLFFAVVFFEALDVLEALGLRTSASSSVKAFILVTISELCFLTITAAT